MKMSQMSKFTVMMFNQKEMKIIMTCQIIFLQILSIEKEMLEELKYKNLISQFAAQKARQIYFK